MYVVKFEGNYYVCRDCSHEQQAIDKVAASLADYLKTQEEYYPDCDITFDCEVLDAQEVTA